MNAPTRLGNIPDRGGWGCGEHGSTKIGRKVGIKTIPTRQTSICMETLLLSRPRCMYLLRHRLPDPNSPACGPCPFPYRHHSRLESHLQLEALSPNTLDAHLHRREPALVSMRCRDETRVQLRTTNLTNLLSTSGHFFVLFFFLPLSIDCSTSFSAYLILIPLDAIFTPMYDSHSFDDKREEPELVLGSPFARRSFV